MTIPKSPASPCSPLSPVLPGMSIVKPLSPAIERTVAQYHTVISSQPASKLAILIISRSIFQVVPLTPVFPFSPGAPKAPGLPLIPCERTKIILRKRKHLNTHAYAHTHPQSSQYFCLPCYPGFLQIQKFHGFQYSRACL